MSSSIQTAPLPRKKAPKPPTLACIFGDSKVSSIPEPKPVKSMLPFDFLASQPTEKASAPQLDDVLEDQLLFRSFLLYHISRKIDHMYLLFWRDLKRLLLKRKLLLERRKTAEVISFKLKLTIYCIACSYLKYLAASTFELINQEDFFPG